MTSKYDALITYLDPLEVPLVTLTFAEVEAIVGPLPREARQGTAWWGSGRGARYQYIHAFRWRRAGWAADRPDLAAGTVTFRRLARS